MATGTKKSTASKKKTDKAAPKAKKSSKEPRSEEAASYDRFKEYEGQRYTGMKIGRTHSWNYDSGRWKEKKITPDLWQINYAVTKRRAGRAPEGSGVPVGTEYHWYILAHQNVAKLNANDYTTSLAGLKFKIAHKRTDTEKWSATEKTQRKRMIRFLQDVIADLEAQSDDEVSEPAKSEVPAAKRAAAKRSSTKPQSTKRSSTKRATTKRLPARRGTVGTSGRKRAAASR